MKEKICAFCGEPFIPNSNFQRYCKRPHYMNCPVCGKQYLVTNNENLKRPPVACSYACRAKRTRETSLQRYGIVAPGNNSEAREKARSTMQEKYGVDYTLQSSELKEKVDRTVKEKYGVDYITQNEEVSHKIEQTNLKKYGSKTYLTSEKGKQEYIKIMQEKYGVTHPMHSKEIKQKVEDTMQERYGAKAYPASDKGKQEIRDILLRRYGVEHVGSIPFVPIKASKTSMERYDVSNPSKHPKIKEKIRSTMMERYGTLGVMNVPEIREKIIQTTMERYGVPYYVMKDEVRKSSGAISKLNLKFKDQLDQIGVEYIMEYGINSYSYDFYLPNKNMLIELNPTYTHNLLGNHWDNNGKPLNYHFNKCVAAINSNLDIRCVFDWDSSEDLVDELKCSEISLDTKDCQVYMLKRNVGIEFLSKYGKLRKTNYPKKIAIYGLVYNDKIYSAIAIAQNEIEFDYVVYNYGTRWGYQDPFAYYDILKFINNMIALQDIKLQIELDRLTQIDLEMLNAKIEKFIYPDTYWSKKSDRIICKRYRKDNHYLEEGWLPIEDCGYAICTFDYLDLYSYTN